MLKRLSTANDEIVEVLLSKQQVLGALRFIRSIGTSALPSLSKRYRLWVMGSVCVSE